MPHNYNYRFRPSIGQEKKEDTILVYFIDYDSYGWPSFGLDNSNNEIWSVPEDIPAGKRSRDWATSINEDGTFSILNYEGLEQTYRTRDYWGYLNSSCIDWEGDPFFSRCIQGKIQLNTSDDQNPNDLLKVKHTARSDNGELDWLWWRGSSFGSSMTYTYSVLNERYGTSVDPVEEDFNNLLYFIKEHRPTNLKGIIIVPLRSRFSETIHGQFIYSSPIFMRRLDILKQRIEEEELQDFFIITDAQWTGENNTVLGSRRDGVGCCPYSWYQTFLYDCPFQYPIVTPTENASYVSEDFSGCSEEELNLLECQEFGSPPPLWNTISSGFQDPNCTSENCSTPSSAYSGDSCICQPFLENPGTTSPISHDCACTFSFNATPNTCTTTGPFSGDPVTWISYGENDFWRSPTCSPFTNDFSPVVIEAVNQLIGEDGEFDRFIFMSDKKVPGRNRKSDAISELSTRQEILEIFSEISESYGGTGPEFDYNEYSDAPYFMNEIHLTLDSLYNYYGSEDAVSLKNKFLSWHMDEIRKRIVSMQSYYDFLTSDQFGVPYVNWDGIAHYKCWSYIEPITEENYRIFLKDTRGFGGEFYYNWAPHNLFRRPSEKVKFYFSDYYSHGRHVQQGEKTFHRVPETISDIVAPWDSSISAEETYTDDELRYYDSLNPLDNLDSLGEESRDFEEDLSVRVGSNGLIKHNEFFIENIIKTILNTCVFSTNTPERFFYTNKVCEMNYKQPRSAINRGFFSVERQTEFESFNDPVDLEKIDNGDPGDFFSFNDEIFYDPYGDLRDIVLRYTISIGNPPPDFPQANVYTPRANAYFERFSTGDVYINGKPFQATHHRFPSSDRQFPWLNRTPLIRSALEGYTLVDLYGKNEVQGYASPYPPPFNYYKENLPETHANGATLDKWIHRYQPNGQAPCNCWESTVLAPYLNGDQE